MTVGNAVVVYDRSLVPWEEKVSGIRGSIEDQEWEEAGVVVAGDEVDE